MVCSRWLIVELKLIKWGIIAKSFIFEWNMAIHRLRKEYLEWIGF
jgi:hypothetical protein